MKDFSTYELPIFSDNPSGSDIEYDSRFLDLQRLAEGTPEQQFGDMIIEQKEPEWASLEKLCNQLLAESKDVRLFTYNILILTNRYGLSGFEAGCRSLCINLERYWDQLYPLLVDEDGDEDSHYRINALSLLVSPQGVPKYLGATKFINNGLNHQPISLKEACLLLQNDSKINYAGGRERLLLDIKVGIDANKPEFISIKNSLDYLQKIERIFNENINSSLLPNFDAINRYFHIILGAAKNESDAVQLPSKGELEGSQPTFDSQNPQDSLPPLFDTAHHPEVWRRASITSRKDVELILEKVCVYFEEYEPSHPGPLLIRRIQRLMNMNFYDIMKDISPNSLDNLETLIGRSQDEGSS